MEFLFQNPLLLLKGLLGLSRIASSIGSQTCRWKTWHLYKFVWFNWQQLVVDRPWLAIHDWQCYLGAVASSSKGIIVKTTTISYTLELERSTTYISRIYTCKSEIKKLHQRKIRYFLDAFIPVLNLNNLKKKNMKKRWCFIWSPNVAPSSFQPSLEAQRDGAAWWWWWW